MCQLVDISHHYKIAFMSSTTLGELCLGRGPELLQYAGEWFCCRGFRQIVAGILRGGSKALCQMEDEYIGDISYKFRDPRGRVP